MELNDPIHNYGWEKRALYSSKIFARVSNKAFAESISAGDVVVKHADDSETIPF